MFTQLDLFGDLPSTEKQSDKPSKPEKRTNTRNAGSGPNPPVQAQLTMGLPEQESPDQLRMFGESRADQEKKEGTEDPDRIVTELEELTANPKITGIEYRSVPVESISDSRPETPAINTLPGPGAMDGQTPPETLTNNVESATRTGENPSPSVKKYYIQTEIPADPPLEPRQVSSDLGMISLAPTREINPETKPRYIQTEIPSDPPVNSAEHTGQDYSASLSNDAKEQPSSQVNTESLAGLTADESISYSSEPERKPASHDISPERLRRTRPLMPPKVILAEPTAEDQRPMKSFSDHLAIQPDVKAAPEPDHTDEPPVVPATTSSDIVDHSEVGENTANPTGVIDSPKEHIPASAMSEARVISPTAFSIDRSPAVDNSPKKTGVRSTKPLRDDPAETGNSGIPPDEVLNSKQYYSIGEVALMFSVKPSLLRYWESEFDVLKLRKNRKGDRFFRPDDIRSLQLIHHLLREKKYTIEGAREYMRNARKMKEKFETIEALQRIRQFLVEMRNGLQTANIEEPH